MTATKDSSMTQDWLESILDGHYSALHPEEDEDLHVESWDILPMEGDNYLSEILSLDVRYSVGSQDKRARLVAKLLPQDPDNKEFVIETQFDLREIKFYTEIRPALEEAVEHRLGIKNYILPSPDCFHAVHKEGSESILVMEDLKQKGFHHQDLTAGLTLPQAEAAIDSLVQIHSAGIAYQREEKTELRRRFPYLLTPFKAIEAFRSLFEKGLPLMLKFLEKKPNYSKVRARLQQYDENRCRECLQKILQPSDKLNTIVHCDFWCNNLLFKTGEGRTDCCVIDWQMTTGGRPAIDLSMLLTTSLSPEMRRSCGEKIIKSYWKGLTNRLQELNIKGKDFEYTFEDLKVDMRHGTLFGALIMIGSFDLALGTPKREERVLALLEDLIESDIL